MILCNDVTALDEEVMPFCVLRDSAGLQKGDFPVEFLVNSLNLFKLFLDFVDF